MHTHVCIHCRSELSKGPKSHQLRLFRLLYFLETYLHLKFYPHQVRLSKLESKIIPKVGIKDYQSWNQSLS